MILNIDKTLELSDQVIMSRIEIWLRVWFESSEWLIESVDNYYINISKYNHLSASYYIKLAEELDHPRKGLICNQNMDDNECF